MLEVLFYIIAIIVLLPIVWTIGWILWTLLVGFVMFLIYLGAWAYDSMVQAINKWKSRGKG